jgi:hypothetical protein
MVLVLSRGHYCPKNHQQHLELAAAYPKIVVAYTQVMTDLRGQHLALEAGGPQAIGSTDDFGQSARSIRDNPRFS